MDIARTVIEWWVIRPSCSDFFLNRTARANFIIIMTWYLDHNLFVALVRVIQINKKYMTLDENAEYLPWPKQFDEYTFFKLKIAFCLTWNQLYFKQNTIPGNVTAIISDFQSIFNDSKSFCIQILWFVSVTSVLWPETSWIFLIFLNETAMPVMKWYLIEICCLMKTNVWNAWPTKHAR